MGFLHIKNRRDLKDITAVENNTDVFTPKWIIHIKFAGISSTVENKQTGKMLPVALWPLYINNFLHDIKQIKPLKESEL